ncbi:hypothetical protein GCM10010411_48320 [Actinomadura fulvescens]|uniref:Fibronectin type-III domain-containing protein n=1 Tax=Actinomadura fulvescens TaxID=46160 RepID=A0ABP6CFV7_9ACTN
MVLTAKLAEGSQYVARVTARHGGRSVGRDVTVNPGLKSVSIPPHSDPNSVSVNPHFTGPAPASGLTVKVASDNPAITVPSTAFFPAGTYGGDIGRIQVRPVTKNTKVTISVTLGTRTLKASKVLIPPFDGTQGVSIHAAEPGDLYGLQHDLSYRVVLANPAPVGGLSVELKVKDGDPAITLDNTTDHISEGGTTAYFRLRTADVTRTTRTGLEATVLGAKASLPITIHPRLSGLSLPASVKGGTSFTGTVTLAGPSDVDTTIWLDPSGGVLNVQRSVIIPAGATSATFEATSLKVETPESAYISARLGGTETRTHLTVTP